MPSGPLKSNMQRLVSTNTAKTEFVDLCDVVVQSNTKPWDDFYFVQHNGPNTTLTADVVVSGTNRILNVASVANISVGDFVGVFATEERNRHYWGVVLSINVLALTMDTLIDFPFTAATSVVVPTTHDMNVNGSVTPQVFHIEAGMTGSDYAIDVSRLLLACQTSTAVSLNLFGDLAALTNGLMLRVKENGWYRNKINIKTNFEFGLFAFDWAPYAATNPTFGQDGFLWRFSLNGPDKHDAVSRITDGDAGTIEWVIQDDLRLLEVLHSVGANSEVTP